MHICDADCWAYLVRFGFDSNSADCDPFEARAAAENEIARDAIPSDWN